MNTLKTFIERKEVQEVKTLNMLISDEFYHFKGIDFKHDTSLFNCGKNSILIFDCRDYNSAFVHEYFMNQFNDGFTLPEDVQIKYMQSSNDTKNFIKHWHKNIWEMTDEQLKRNPNAKFEIFIIFFKDGEIYAKSDDYDVINQSTINAIFDIFNDEIDLKPLDGSKK